jgi:lysophospholipase L1-like esterase
LKLKLDRNKYLESRSLRPRTLLIVIISVNILLGLVVALFPKEGIPLADDQKLKFISFEELSGKGDTPIEINIDEVLAGVSPMEEDSSSLENVEMKSSSEQSIAIKDNIIKPEKKYVISRSLQLPLNNPEALRTLLYGLINESKSKVVRILHYGDSQLEGDRITDYFRNKMQKRFGGKGPGILLPNEPAASSRISAYVSSSTNIKKKAIYINGSKASDGKYGIGGSVFEISGGNNYFKEWKEGAIDSNLRTPVFSVEKQANAFIQVKNGHYGYKLARKYDKTTLLYESDEYFNINIRSDMFEEDYLILPSQGLATYRWNLGAKKKLKLSFTKGKFPKIYGLALDGNEGVAVDNFAMRGSSAVGFDKMDKLLYGKQLKEMNVCAIFLQYGINVVPNERSDYGYYKKILISQLKSIKSAQPGVSIVVIGPSDMSKNKGGNMVSYSNIPLIRDAMKEAALETGCCFWDLYEAMGGENSMPAWVEKGLAQKDYTHFSYKGARYVGEMLYNAVMEQVEKK